MSSATTARSTTEAKKKILGLNAARLYGVEVPEELRLPDGAGTPARRTTGVSSRRATA